MNNCDCVYLSHVGKGAEPQGRATQSMYWFYS